MVWNILSFFAAYVIPVFYRRIQARNLSVLKARKPIIIAMNHPNAFTDPVALVWLFLPGRLKFLARGDAFKPGLLSRFLESIGIIPIFRIQDAGKEGLKKNDESYQRVNAHLKKNAKVIVFAEGLCVQERRLRPLKKGVARMVFGAWDAISNEDLLVVPVGVNYSDPPALGSDVFYNIGEPIRVKDLAPAYRENPARAYNAFLAQLQERMKALITHINDPANDRLVEQAEIIQKNELIVTGRHKPGNLENDFAITAEITNRVNTAHQELNPDLEQFRSLSEDYFAQLKAAGTDDLAVAQSKNKLSYLFHLLLCLLMLPLYLTGAVINYPAVFLSMFTTRKLVKTKEFYSSFMIGFLMVYFNLLYILLALALTTVLGSFFLGFAAAVALGTIGFISLRFHHFVKRTIRRGRFAFLGEKAHHLQTRRQNLLNLINKF